MSRAIIPNVVVGNEFTLPQPKIRMTTPVAAPQPVLAAPTLDDVQLDFEKVPRRGRAFFTYPLEVFHRYSVGAFALLFLVVGSSAITVGGAYQSARITLATNSSNTLRIPAQPLRGPNTIVALASTGETVQRIINQPLSLTVGGQPVAINADTIKSWLQVVANHKQGVAYIHVNETAIGKSLDEAATPFTKAASDQVTVTYSDGSSSVIATGKNGSKVGDTTAARQQIAQSLLGAKGLQANLPVESLAFAAVTPAAFDKLIEVNVVSKQMWLYDKGALTHQYPISAGAAATPTPIGQFKIYSKLAVQDMKGFNADGSKYLQPHVRWINYFLPGGYAVHGNYWRPQSWFGAINSSHGCVSLPDSQAKEVYDWAPLGTTVITHA